MTRMLAIASEAGTGSGRGERLVDGDVDRGTFDWPGHGLLVLLEGP